MAIGGFNGTDPAPSLAAFEADVAAGKIHHDIEAGGFGGAASGDANVAGDITGWVESHYTPGSLGGTTVYDLTQTAT